MTHIDQTATAVLSHIDETSNSKASAPSSIPRRFRDKATEYRQLAFSEADLTDIDCIRRLLLKHQTRPKDACTMERAVRNAIKYYCAYLMRVDHANHRGA